MLEGVLDHDRAHLLGDEAGQSLVEAHADAADAFRLQADGRSENEFAPLRLEQVDGADGRLEALLDEADDVGERLVRVVAVRNQPAALLESQQQRTVIERTRVAHGTPPSRGGGMIIGQNESGCNGREQSTGASPACGSSWRTGSPWQG